MKKVYILEQLGCANCGAKIEHDVAALNQVEEAVLVFPTKQLRVQTECPEGLDAVIQEIARKYEPDITVRDRDSASPAPHAEHHEHHHHHDHDGDCCCGHDHEHEHHHHHDDDECGCGHDHEHEHEHHHHHHDDGDDDDCCCGHDHEHEHHHHHRHDDDDDCCCGHDNEHEHHHHHHHAAASAGEQHTYILEDLCCANCGAKIERAVNELDAVEDAVLVFPTKQLRVTASDHTGILEAIQKIAKAIEPDVIVHDPDAEAVASGKQHIYRLEDLCCANCGAKIERAVNELDAVESAVLVFPTKQLRVTASDHTGMLEAIQSITKSIEPDVTVTDLTAASASPLATTVPSAEKKPESWLKQHTDQAEIISGAILFVIGLILSHTVQSFVPALIVCAVAYIILGRRVVWTAVRNMTHGNVFDENFLMSIATLGAFAIQSFDEAVGVMLFFRIGEFFEDVAVEKSRSQIMEAVDLRPETVNLERGDSVDVIPASQAKPGDILVIRVGDRVPLDGVILSGESFLDTSAITGEPVPVRVAPGDELTSGCVNTEGVLRMRVTRPLSESMVTRILDSVENAAASKPKIDRFITRFARIYTPFVVALALIVAIVPSIVTGNWYHWVYTALTFLVISCPCALVLSVPLAFFSGIGTGSRKGILFKGGIALEALASVKAVIMDKTGTLTHGTFTVTDMQPAEGVSEEELLTAAACCEQNSTHPIATSILSAAKQRLNSLPHPDRVHEAAGHGIRAEYQQSTLLCGNAALMQQEGIALPQLDSVPGATVVLLARDNRYLGRILLSDTLKDGAAQTVSLLKRKGVASAILTGDVQESAAAIAQQAGIDEVHAQLLPQDKLSALNSLRQKYGPVLFVGDGINDAPVLAGADVGAAMGSGADAAIEAADVVYLTSELNAIPQSIRIAQSAANVAKQNIVFALIVKALVMVLGLLGIASMWLAVFADTGVAMLCVLNSIRILYQK